MIIQTKQTYSTEALRKKLAKKFDDCEVKTIGQNVMIKKSAAMVHIRTEGKNLNIYGSINSSHLLSYIGIAIGPFTFFLLEKSNPLFVTILIAILVAFLYFFVLWLTQKKQAKRMEMEVIEFLS